MQRDVGRKKNYIMGTCERVHVRLLCLDVRFGESDTCMCVKRLCVDLLSRRTIGLAQVLIS